ncbi:MAG: hypothetical protein ACLSVD_14100, partial [Eggerthellaceae bacterium]
HGLRDRLVGRGPLRGHVRCRRRALLRRAHRLADRLRRGPGVHGLRGERQGRHGERRSRRRGREPRSHLRREPGRHHGHVQHQPGRRALQRRRGREPQVDPHRQNTPTPASSTARATCVSDMRVDATANWAGFGPIGRRRALAYARRRRRALDGNPVGGIAGMAGDNGTGTDVVENCVVDLAISTTSNTRAASWARWRLPTAPCATAATWAPCRQPNSRRAAS